MKKRKLRGLLAVVIAIALVVGITAATVFAGTDTPTVIFDYRQGIFEFRNVGAVDEHSHYPNLFQAKMQGLVPGDSVEQKIRVTAENLAGGTVQIHLSVDPEAVIDETITDEEREAYKTLLDYRVQVLESEKSVELVISNEDGAEISSGSLKDGVMLGTFSEGDEVELTVTLDIPVEAGNELQGLQAAVEWVFTAQYYPAYKPPYNPPGGDTPVGPELNVKEHFAYIIGRDDGLVHPEANITRAEAVTIFFRMLTDESRNQYWSKTNPYVDVAADAWYNNAVSTLTNAGIITGKPGNIFDPEAPITRAEFAAMAVRFFGGTYEGEDLFSDIAGHWANKEINLAALKELVLGYPDGTFQPDREISRAEAMAIVNRLLERKPHEDHLLEGMITWPDNMDTNTWYYAHVQEATNSHSYVLRYDAENEAYEVWTELLPVRDWAALERMWSNANSASNPGEVISSKYAAVFN